MSQDDAIPPRSFQYIDYFVVAYRIIHWNFDILYHCSMFVWLFRSLAWNSIFFCFAACSAHQNEHFTFNCHVWPQKFHARFARFHCRIERADRGQHPPYNKFGGKMSVLRPYTAYVGFTKANAFHQDGKVGGILTASHTWKVYERKAKQHSWHTRIRQMNTSQFSRRWSGMYTM